MRPRDLADAGHSIHRTALPAMTQDAEAATPRAEPQVQHQSPDLLGVTYLATLGIVMTIWIGGLVWAAAAVVEWLMF
jgi:hypothetical protein